MKRSLAVLSFSMAYAYVSACCGVARSGQPVKFGDQSNIIVWNPDTKIEHFVRNAYFDSKAKDFGFIAATPNQPDLATAKGEVFDTLERIRPPSLGCSGGETDSNVAAAGVEILQSVDVGKYHATTVRSDDSSAMARYLQENGYVSNPDIDEWISFYTSKKWVFTAFKVKEGEGGRAETGVVRMSFRATEPFNPYYVPPSNSTGDESGKLKIFFVSDGPYSATIGHQRTWVPASWNTELKPSALKGIADDLNLTINDFPSNPTVTYFEKRNWLEGIKDDLYFKKDSKFGSILVGVLAVIGGGLWWFTKSNKAKLTSKKDLSLQTQIEPSAD